MLVTKVSLPCRKFWAASEVNTISGARYLKFLIYFLSPLKGWANNTHYLQKQTNGYLGGLNDKTLLVADVDGLLGFSGRPSTNVSVSCLNSLSMDSL